MNPQQHQEIYRIAFESATSELTQINEEFNRLRARMEQLERLAAALKPLVFEDGNEAVETSDGDLTDEPIETVAESPQQTTAEPAKIGSDPFQRRINHVLGIGGGIRDVRSYTRQF